ncbi:MAG: hypothetical protein ACKVVT_19170 [Dehalococcoidia bacterium]
MASQHSPSLLRAIMVGGALLALARTASRHRGGQARRDRRSRHGRRGRSAAFMFENERASYADGRADEASQTEDEGVGAIFRAFVDSATGDGGGARRDQKGDDSAEIARALLWLLDRTESARDTLRTHLSRVAADGPERPGQSDPDRSAWV